MPAGLSLTLALTGDSIISRPWSCRVDPRFLSVVDLVRGQDAAFTNLEICLHDYETYPMVESGGLHLRAAPAIAEELVWAGFRLVSFANNHAGDWGAEGMRLTRTHARRAGLVVAGVGESLREARAAQFLETVKGRIALVACASTFTTNARAGASYGDIPARPGVSALRFKRTYVLTSTGLSAIRAAARELRPQVPEAGPVLFMDHLYEAGEQAGARSEAHAGDLEQIAAEVRSARDLSDLTIVSIHAHEDRGDRDVPAEFVTTFARAMIDAGADVVVGHGPHVLRGIEIYRGKPIFYSLGNFVFQNETIERLPLEDYEAIGADPANGVAGLNDVRNDNDRRGAPAERAMWESVIAVPSWHDRTLSSISLHPVSLGFGMPRMMRGTPQLAAEEEGGKIIADLQRLSEPFGTSIAYRNAIGVVGNLGPVTLTP